MPVFWRTLAVLGSVALVLLIAIAITVSTVDVGEFVGPIKARVKEATGRDLTVGGGIDLKLGFEPRLVLDDVTLGNAAWGKEAQMLSAKHIEIQVALLPLLHKRFEVIRLRLIEPRIALETDSKGKGNWEVSAPPAAARDSTPAPSGLEELVVADLAISDGAITYLDGRTGEVTTIAVEQMDMHARDAQSPIMGSFRGKVNGTSVALEGNFGPLEQLRRQQWPYPVTVQGEVNGKKTSIGTQLRWQDNTIGLEPMNVTSGSSALTGKMTVLTGGTRPKLTFKLDAPTLSLADVALPVGPVAAKVSAPSRYVFSDTPMNLAALKDFDAEGEITIGTLALLDGRHLEGVHAQLTLVNGSLDVPVLRATAFGGSVLGRLKLDASRPSDATLDLHLEAKNLELAPIAAAMGVRQSLQGGATEVRIDIVAQGASPRHLASTASGNVIAVVGHATLGSTAGADSPLDRLASVMDPFRKTDPTTQLHCAVIRLPLKSGVATVDRSIAIETGKLGAIASGTVDFRDETIDLSIKPQIRQGIAITVPQVAELVRFHGPFTGPSVGIDATATAATVARLGAAMSTGGLSVLGETLLAQARADPGAPCQIALGRGGAGASTAKSTSVPAAATEGIGKALGRLFGK